METFNSQEEIYQYLLSGGTVVDVGSPKLKIKFINGHLFNVTTNKQVFYSLDDSKYWCKYIEQQWYDNIPEEGILVWVWSEVHKSNFLARVNKYYKKSNCIAEGTSYCERIIAYDMNKVMPLTKEEIKTFYDNAE